MPIVSAFIERYTKPESRMNVCGIGCQADFRTAWAELLKVMYLLNRRLDLGNRGVLDVRMLMVSTKGRDRIRVRVRGEWSNRC